MKACRVIVLLAVWSFGTAAADTSAHAQIVTRAGAGSPEHDRRLDAVLEAGDYVLIAADTLIARTDTIRLPVLALDATLIVEGTVAADLVAVGANVFLRPSAAVRGDVVNIAGGLYRSELARIEGTIVDNPLAPYRVVRAPDRFVVEGLEARPRWVLDGLLGFHPPAYDRVDALSIRWGATYHVPFESVRGSYIYGRVGYATGRDAITGRVEAGRRAGSFSAGVGAARETATNEEWIRGDLANTLSVLATGRDYRDYHEARRADAFLRRDLAYGAWDGSAIGLRIQLEKARSLPARDPWTLFGDADRANPPVDEDLLASAIVGADLAWRGATSIFEGATEVELGTRVDPPEDRFVRLLLDGRWTMAAFADHTLRVDWRFQGPAPGTRELPRRRWTFVGGSGTLPTFDIAEFRGDRLVFVGTRYTIPLPERLSIPVLGRPEFELMHRAAMAWSADTARDLEQNLGVRLRFSFVNIRIAIDPSRRLRDADLGIGVHSPFRPRRPWER